MKWSEAKEKSADKTWAFLELRPTGKVMFVVAVAKLKWMRRFMKRI